MNDYEGTLPECRYDWFTEIHFCCRTDGDKNDPILLPSKSPFFLLAYNSSKCQMVKWAIASVEWIYYFTNDHNNGDESGGAYPYNAGKMHPTIYYCYYKGEGRRCYCLLSTRQAKKFGVTTSIIHKPFDQANGR